MSGLFATDGSLNVTVVTGSTKTGLYAADGSLNVVVATGVSYVGLYNACGALNVTVATSNRGHYAADGSLYIIATPYTYLSAQKVTVVSGSLSSAGPYLLLADGTSKLLLANGTDKLLIVGHGPGTYTPTYYILGF